MSSAQLVAVAANVGIYAALIGFVLYRQMRPHPLTVQRLVLLPAVLGFLGLQQLGRQRLGLDLGAGAFFVANIIVGLGLGLWRGTTFRLWEERGLVVMKGTAATLVAWALLFAVRLPSAFASHVASRPQGFVVGELLLALGITFGAQNLVLWLRSRSLAVPAGA